MRVISKIKRIKTKPVMIKTYCNSEKERSKEDISNQSCLYSMAYNKQKLNLSAYY